MQITALPIITMDQGALASDEALGYGGISKEVIVKPTANMAFRGRVARCGSKWRRCFGDIHT
jgi:hypothetical protein